MVAEQRRRPAAELAPDCGSLRPHPLPEPYLGGRPRRFILERPVGPRVVVPARPGGEGASHRRLHRHRPGDRPPNERSSARPARPRRPGARSEPAFQPGGWGWRCAPPGLPVWVVAARAFSWSQRYPGTPLHCLAGLRDSAAGATPRPCPFASAAARALRPATGGMDPGQTARRGGVLRREPAPGARPIMETIGEVSSMPMWGCLVRETSRAPVTGRQGCLPWRSCRSGSPRVRSTRRSSSAAARCYRPESTQEGPAEPL
jgi:hypothetical protein